jgi:G3E family GTPase
MKIPVYLFTGFLEGGKTTIIQESLNDQNFNSGEKTLILLCEEGIEELDPSQFWGQNVTIQVIDSEDMITEENLLSYTKGKKIDRIIIEYNGMWLLQRLYDNFPENWGIYQNMMFADANTFISYNNNMRQLVYDKVKDAEMVVLNRTPSNIDKEEIHKIIRGISRGAAIVYDYPDGHVEYDEIEDPLPFDLDAPVIEIADEDYALWYRDMSEELAKYDGKCIKFKGIIANDPRLAKNSTIIGRHVMTCCVDDIQYAGIVAQTELAKEVKTGEWLRVRGKLKIENNDLYASKGPVLKVTNLTKVQAPKEKVVTLA